MSLFPNIAGTWKISGPGLQYGRDAQGNLIEPDPNNPVQAEGKVEIVQNGQFFNNTLLELSLNGQPLPIPPIPGPGLLTRTGLLKWKYVIASPQDNRIIYGKIRQLNPNSFEAQLVEAGNDSSNPLQLAGVATLVYERL